jgi:predicted amidophosphoribosyltransferase
MIRDLLSPPSCLLCRRRLALPAPSGLCPACAAEVARSRPVHLRADGIDGGHAALPYSGAGRRAVHALKFSRLLAAAELGAGLIAARAPWDEPPGALVAVPGSPLRRALRGFDPASELARPLAAGSGVAVAAPLRRVDLRRQRGRSRGERLARPPRIRAVEVAPRSVVLIDDVVTTGATLSACAEALRGAGAIRVVAAALAAAPLFRRTAEA